MTNKQDILQIIGSLMKKPTLLSQVDKYTLSMMDFSTRFERYLFNAIEGLYHAGAERINPIDIENYLSTNDASKVSFEQHNGIEYLQDAIELSDELNFDYYYKHLKKINLLNSLKKNGFDISEFYCENLTDIKAIEVNARFETLTIADILEQIKKKVVIVEKEYVQGGSTETSDAFAGMMDLLDSIHEQLDIGKPLQGEILNEIMSGAQKGKLCIRSGRSGLGKTRNMVGDACFLAFPMRYSQESCTWEVQGGNEKVLYICTEQQKREIQMMILAYLTGINESNLKYNKFSKREELIIKQALTVVERYRDNFQIVVMPNPTNELIKSIIRENYMINHVDYVFYDYIFIGPALLNEFKGFALRNDELLLILSTTLKDLAAELNVFVMTATQVNAKGDENKEIRDEGSLAGGRATINKADYGFIMARPTKEELETLEETIIKYGKQPNVVMDVFKVRAGEWTQVRVWSIFDLGTLRREDLFMTDNRLTPLSFQSKFAIEFQPWEEEIYEDVMKQVVALNEELYA
jgi:replicative DNA helicase